MNRRQFIRQSLYLSSGAFFLLSPFRLLSRSYAEPIERVYVALGTSIRFIVYHPEPPEARRAIHQAISCIQEIQQRMSTQDRSSELNLWNRSKTGSHIPLHPLTQEAITQAWNMRRVTQNRFDPTIASFSKSHIPLEERQLIWKEERLFKPHPSIRLDLGGSAKGWAVDKAMEILIASGCQAALINAGGDLRVFNAPPDLQAWTIGITDPRAPDKLLSRLHLRNQAIATSGDYIGAISQLRDPRDGTLIALNGSVSVVAPTCGEADAWATALAIEPELPLLPSTYAGVIARYQNNRFIYQTSPNLKGDI